MIHSKSQRLLSIGEHGAHLSLPLQWDRILTNTMFSNYNFCPSEKSSRLNWQQIKLMLMLLGAITPTWDLCGMSAATVINTCLVYSCFFLQFWMSTSTKSVPSCAALGHFYAHALRSQQLWKKITQVRHFFCFYLPLYYILRDILYLLLQIFESC